MGEVDTHSHFVSSDEKHAYTSVSLARLLPPFLVKVWTLLCDISRKEFQKVYDRLGVTLEEHGESSYNDMIPSTIDMLAEAGLISRDDGADIVRLEHFTYPLIVRKRDGERW